MADGAPPAPCGLNTAPWTESSGQTQEPNVVNVASETPAGPKQVLMFKGGDEQQQQMIEILKTGIQYNKGLIFEWGKKEKTLKEILEALNKDPLFNRQLKCNTHQDKWSKAEKKAQDMIKPENVEKFLKLGQNGGLAELPEVNKLLWRLAKTLYDHEQQKSLEIEQAEAADKAAEHQTLEPCSAWLSSQGMTVS